MRCPGQVPILAAHFEVRAARFRVARFREWSLVES
jgi:hypothetical protein